MEKQRKVPESCNNRWSTVLKHMCSWVGLIHIYIHIKEIKDYGALLQKQLGLKPKVSLVSTVNNINLTW